jgi:hypothetical protein
MQPAQSQLSTLALALALAVTLPPVRVQAVNPDISHYQKAVSVEPPGQYENSQDGQVAVVGQTVHLTWFSNAKIDPWTSSSTNRLYYRRSLDGGLTFQPPVLLSETPDPEAPTAVIRFPYGAYQSLAAEGSQVHVLVLRSSDVGGWHYILDYFRSADGGASFAARPGLVVGGTFINIGQPMVAADQGGVSIAYLTWQNWDNHTWVRSLHSADGGATFANHSLDLWNWPGGSSVGLVGLARSGNHVALAWQNDYWNYRNAYVAASTNGGGEFTVTRLNDVNASGAGWVGFQDFTGDNSRGGAIRPKLAWAGQHLYAVWAGSFTNESGVLRAFLARSTDGGATFLPQQCLSLDLPASAGSLEGGHITVAARQDLVYVLFNTASRRLFLKRSEDRGATFQPVQEIGNPDSTTVADGWWNLIQTDPGATDGRRVHVFTGDYYRASTDGGATFSPAVHLSTYFTPGNAVNRAQMAVDAAGRPHLVWDGSYSTATNGTGYQDADVFYRRFDPRAAALSSTNLALGLARGGLDQTTAPGGLRRDNLQLPAAPALAFTNAMTLELWVRPATNCGLNAPLLLRESAIDPPVGAYQILTRGYSPNGGPAPRFPRAILLTTAGRVVLDATTELKDDVWHHLAVTFDAAAATQNARLYVDGHLEAAAPAASPLDPRGGLVWVGRPANSDYFAGSVDDLRFWNRARPAQEILEGHTNRLTGAEPGLVAWYPLDGSTREATGRVPDGVLMYQETFVAGAPLAAQPVVALPTITSQANAAGQVRVAFSYPITAANNPTGFGAAGLPPGLTVDPATGQISGVPLVGGAFEVTLSATNSSGSATAPLSLLIDPAVPLTESTTLQPSGGTNDGTDDGSATRGQDRSQYADAGGSSTVLYLYNSPCNVGPQPAYLQFAVDGPAAQASTRAELSLYCKMFFNGAGWPWTAGAYTVSLRRVTAPWSEVTLPASVAPTPVASRTVTAVGGSAPGFVEFEGWLTFDLTGLYRDWAAGTVAAHGLQLAIDTPYCANGNEFWVYSSDHATASLRPKLTVETGLRPSLALHAEGGNAFIGWSTVSNAIYRVQSSDTLDGWTNWGDPLLGRGGPTNVVVPIGAPERFFRVGAE